MILSNNTVLKTNDGTVIGTIVGYNSSTDNYIVRCPNGKLMNVYNYDC